MRESVFRRGNGDPLYQIANNPIPLKSEETVYFNLSNC